MSRRDSARKAALARWAGTGQAERSEAARKAVRAFWAARSPEERSEVVRQRAAGRRKPTRRKKAGPEPLAGRAEVEGPSIRCSVCGGVGPAFVVEQLQLSESLATGRFVCSECDGSGDEGPSTSDLLKGVL